MSAPAGFDRPWVDTFGRGDDGADRHLDCQN